MADEQYRWLDRETAERLLSGEPPEAADPVARDQAERLAGTLRALSAPPPGTGEELPGEAAALAAFRKVREERDGRTAVAGGDGHRAGAQPSDLGPIRIGTPRADRSGAAAGPRRAGLLRLGLAAALVVGLVGGAAVLAGTGVLPTPSDGSPSDPAASATATGTHAERPLQSPPPEDGTPGGATSGGRHPEGAAGTARDGAGAQGDGGEGADGASPPGKPGPEPGDTGARSGHGGNVAACRAWRDGEALNGERKRLVEEAAGGPSRVGAYCAGVLSTGGAGGAGSTGGAGGAAGTGSTGGKDTDEEAGQGDSRSNGQSGSRSNGQSGGKGNGNSNGTGNGGSNKGANQTQGNQGSQGNQGPQGNQQNQGNHP
ncbi:hypothetical protein AB0D65_26195 [Streptomyces griseoloalbus]|uniref:Extensin n=1 Tax=Streptomyces griseoloalbus TaxID=67303 RepID=A0ABV3EB56_9ACTN